MVWFKINKAPKGTATEKKFSMPEGLWIKCNNCGEIIYKKEAIKQILELLNIPYSDSQIVEGKGTRLDQVLVFLIKSKGKMEVRLGKHKYADHNGIIIIENAQLGEYELKVKGKKEESDEIIVFQIGKDREVWEKIGRKNAPGQVNHYNIQY